MQSSSYRQSANNQRPFAVFDIDGTLIRWQLFHAILDQLGKQGIVLADAYKKVKESRMQWKIRTQQDSFKQYEQELIKAYNSTITGITIHELNRAIDVVFAEYKDQVYCFTRDLLSELKAKNYLLFAISGSQDEIIKKLAEYYGFDAGVGSMYYQKDKKFTGENLILQDEQKINTLKSLIQQFSASNQNSLAIGDSESDIPLLEQVASPIAFNPSQKLFDYARDKHWKIVLERKNVIYQLEQKDGTYTLV